MARVFYETIRDEKMSDMAICRGLHQAVRALRGGRVERTKTIEEGCTTGAGTGDLEVPKVVEANDGRGGAGAACGDEDGLMQRPRDGKLCLESDETLLQSPQYWAPYIHFGV